MGAGLLITPRPHSIPQPRAWLLALCASRPEPPTGITAVAGPAVPTCLVALGFSASLDSARSGLDSLSVAPGR